MIWKNCCEEAEAVLSKSTNVGMLVFSVDVVDRIGVDSNLASPSAKAQRDTAEWMPLLELFQSLRLSATWAIDHQTPRELLRHLCNASPRQEVAILADASWASPETPRRQFGKALSQRLANAQAAGCVIQTIALRGVREIGQPDLLAKHGITAIRSGASSVRWRRWLSWVSDSAGPLASGQPSPRMVRYGVWELPLGTVVNQRTAHTALDRAMSAAATGRLASIVIDGAELAEQPRSWRRFQNALRRAQQFEDRGRLQMGSIAEAVERLSPPRRQPRSRSILRPAA